MFQAKSQFKIATPITYLEAWNTESNQTVVCLNLLQSLKNNLRTFLKSMIAIDFIY